MKRKVEIDKCITHNSKKTLQAEKENIFSKFSHIPSSSNYKGYSSETHLTKNVSSGMKDLCENDKLKICPLKMKFTTYIKERTIHINQCIDGQSSTVIPSQETAEESAFILDCPLCFKHFPTSEVRCTHIKKCGKSRGLSTQSIIQALRLQEKHVLERRALGLPLNNKPTKQPKKPATKKFLLKPKSAMESDIHLAKALSLSLKENENRTQANFDSTDSEDSQPTAILQAPSEFQNPGKFVPKKKTLKPTPLLLLRSEEERQKIILEKVNSIIASSVYVKPATSEQKRTFLWNLCGRKEDKRIYYVEQLLDWISPSDVEVGSKLCNLSQIAGHRIFTQLPCDYTFSFADKKDDDGDVQEDSEDSSLIKSLRSLIGNNWMSDIDIHTASGIVIPAHKLFLALRCPLLKNAFDEPVTGGRHVLHWENTSFDAALHFLNFIYTGSAEWKEDIIDELHQLAVKYEVHDLLNILDSNKETLEMLICEDTKENIEDSVMDATIPSKGDIVPSAEHKHDLNENYRIANESAKIECQNANNGYFNDKDASNGTVCTNSKNLKNVVLDQDEVVCIQHTEIAKDMMDLESISAERNHNGEDIFILNKHSASCVDKNDSIYNLNLENCDADSNSSDDSCKILKANISSESKTSFDAYQEEVINIVRSKVPHASEESAYSTSLYTTSSKTSVENVNPSFEKSINSSNMLSPKISPYTFHKNILNECIFSEIYPFSVVRNAISPSSVSPFSKTEFKVGSTEKKSDSLSYFKIEKVNEAVITLEDECNEPGKETNHSSFLSKSLSTNNSENRIFSPRKISPWKSSNLKSPSFNDLDVMRSQNISVENRSSCEQRELHVQHSLLKSCTFSPDFSIFSNNKESPLKYSPSSPIARPEISNYNKDKSFKRNLEQSLYDDVYPMNSLSSPEILICDSDNEFEPIIEKSSLNKTEYVLEKSHTSNNEMEAVLYNENYETSDSVFASNGKKNSFSSINEKLLMPEIICCNSDSDNDVDVTLKLHSTHERNNINFDKNRDLNESKFNECNRFSDKDENTSDGTNTNNPVLDVIDCCSNSNENIDVIEQLQFSRQTVCKTKETTSDDDDECFKFIPLSERIEAAKSKINSCKTVEDLAPSSPESPWIFQTDKLCGVRPLEKDPNVVKSSAHASQQICDTTPNRLPKRSKSKSLTAGNQTEKSNSAVVINGLQPKFKISDSPVTPLPDYKSMMTPDLKQALKRVGVKPLPRQKAVAVLSHIYNETHPWNDDQSGESLDSQTQTSQKSTSHKKNLSLPKKRKQTNEKSDQPSKKTVKSQSKKITQVNEATAKTSSESNKPSNTKQSSSPAQTYSSETKTSSPDITSSPDGSNNSRENYYNLSSDFSDSSQPDSKENVRNVTQYIMSNDDSFKKILTYSPLNLMEFQHELKENGISVSVQKLMDYFDEQCITFTCPRSEVYKRKQQARTQRFRKRMIAKMSQQKS
ncbi:Structure-specific endonuclease subunit SLX4 like protein [Argiope bruennichi]|uniref:Structure-specific endonuclease subunit SLX4 n=1 Tax=Argiope bruennichi TaxID=94029 RepID=A0A8T0FQH7_ARGBR|nr:Structure-specific endonuclease subunit SLX4 like protein [Argiope bruennichi]